MNTFLYYFGRIGMPIIGFVFNMCTLMLFYRYTYYFFFHFNDLRIYYMLLSMERSEFTIKYMLEQSTCYEINGSNCELVLWHEEQMVTLHNGKTNACILGMFSSAKWDRKLNNKIYNLFK